MRDEHVRPAITAVQVKYITEIKMWAVTRLPLPGAADGAWPELGVRMRGWYRVLFPGWEVSGEEGCFRCRESGWRGGI